MYLSSFFFHFSYQKILLHHCRDSETNGGNANNKQKKKKEKRGHVIRRHGRIDEAEPRKHAYDNESLPDGPCLAFVSQLISWPVAEKVGM